MKLDDTPVNIRTSAQFTSLGFDIGDERVIMEILRGKIYSNPIRTICQEICCNARDAHREVGKDDLPIRVFVPTEAEQCLKIRDFGPGITPERMENVFVRYGNSTKREADKETGGFGLGAKSPFAYSDTFTVVSITPDKDTAALTRREYIAYIDETKLGKMSLVKEEPSTEPQGTEIIVPVKKREDREQFIRWVRESTRFWRVRPEIFPKDRVVWKEMKVLFAAENGSWMVFEENIIESNSYSTLNFSAVIDGVPYKVNIDELGADVRKFIENKIVMRNDHLAIFFKTGEIRVTANREEIDYQQEVINVIKHRFNSYHRESLEMLSSVIKSSSDINEAYRKYGIIMQLIGCQRRDITTTFTWKDIKIRSQYSVPTTEGHHDDIEIRYYQQMYNEHIKECARGRQQRDIMLCGEPKTIIVENDGCNNIRSRVKTLMKNGIRHVMIIKLLKKETRDLLDREIGWSQMNVMKLSSVAPTKKERDPSDEGPIPYSGPSMSLIQICGENGFRRITREEAIKIDEKNGKGVYIVKSGGRMMMKLDDGRSLTERNNISPVLKEVKDAGMNLYLFKETVARRLGPGWKSLQAFMEERLKNFFETQQELIERIAVRKMVYEDGAMGSSYRNAFFALCKDQEKLTKLKKFIRSEDSLIIKFIEKYADVLKDQQGVDHVSVNAFMMVFGSQVSRTIYEKSMHIRKEIKKLNKRYPLFNFLECSGYSERHYRDCFVKIAKYVNMCDGAKRKEKIKLAS